jgi:ribosomal protein S18 acetylase RimI-like enzyme
MGAALTLTPSHIRPLNVRRDLMAVADLIDLCFALHMDADGMQYVSHLRHAAQDSRYLNWAPGAHENVSIPLHGYVWIEDDRIVGNLTLIPFLHKAEWRYLIANVAVHPDYRRRGIGRMLTERALEHIHDHGAKSAWLQVREDNPIAHQLYSSLGFHERAFRASWESTIDQLIPEIPVAGVIISARTSQDWPQQLAWLNDTYPPEVAWNLNFSANRYSPALWRTIWRFMNGDVNQHWAAYQFDELIGTVTWDPSPYHQDLLWVAAAPAWEDLAIRALLPVVRNSIHNRHTLVVNYPAGHAAEVFKASGFEQRNILVWMEVKFS